MIAYIYNGVIGLICFIMMISYLKKILKTIGTTEDIHGLSAFTANWGVFAVVGFASMFANCFIKDDSYNYFIKSMQAGTSIIMAYLSLHNKIAAKLYHNKKAANIIYSISHFLFNSLTIIILSAGFLTIHGDLSHSTDPMATRVHESNIFYTSVYFLAALTAVIILPLYSSKIKSRLWLKMGSIFWAISALPEVIMAICNVTITFFTWFDNITWMLACVFGGLATLAQRKLEKMDKAEADVTKAPINTKTEDEIILKIEESIREYKD